MDNNCLIYFVRYNNILQMSTHIRDQCVISNYSECMLEHFLDHEERYNMCRVFVQFYDKKHILSDYILSFPNNREWFKLLMSFPEVDIKDNYKDLLEDATCLRYADILRYVLDNFDIKCANERFELVSMNIDYALRASVPDFELFKYYIENGADIRACHYESIKLACEWQSMDILNYIFTEVLVENYDFNTIIDIPVRSGCIEVLDYLLKVFSPCEKERLRCIKSNRLLRCAAYNGHLNIVKWLIARGADPSDCNHEALRNAIENNKKRVAKYLMKLFLAS